MSKKRKLAFTFWLLAITQIFILNLNEYVTIRPQSIHQWRQTVSLNIALNYMKQDNGLLQPETNFLNADEKTTGIAQGEFPLFYYGIGKIWRLTGQQEWIYRLITLSLFLTALWSIALFLFDQTKRVLASAIVPLLFFATPVLAYYSVSFLMDSVSFSLIILGWYSVYRINKSQHKQWYLWMFLAFLFAGLFKVTSLISVIALIGWCMGSLVFPRLFGRLVNDQWRKPALLLGLLVIILNVLWYVFAINYNNEHGGWYTENGIYPVWEMTKERLDLIIDWVTSYWYHQYAPGLFYFFFGLAFIYTLVFIKALKAHRFFIWITSLTFIGSLIYVLLWVQVFHEHDYYVIAVYPFFLAIILLSFILLHRHTTNAGFNLVSLALLLILLFGSYKSGVQLHIRVADWPNNGGDNRFSSYFTIEPYLRKELGLTRYDKVIAYSDESVCISLYLCDQKGWQMTNSDGINFVENRIQYGAEYLLVNDSSFYDKPDISSLELKKIGHHKKISIFKLGSNKGIK